MDDGSRINDLVSAELDAETGHHFRRRTAFDWVRTQLGRIRLQLFFGAVAAMVLPGALSAAVVDVRVVATEQYWNSVIGGGAAFVIGYVVFRKVTAFPGVRAATNILPCFMASYGLMAIAFMAFRIDYNRLILVASFGLTVAVLFAMFSLARRSQRPVLSLALVGEGSRLLRLNGVDWRPVEQPRPPHSGPPLVVDLHAVLSPAWETFIADCALAGRPIFSAREVRESISGRVSVQHISEATFRAFTPNLIYGAAKRHVDAVVAMAFLVLLAPLYLAIALAIRWDSPGPALFRQERRGYRGKVFVCYKFRTMRHEPEASAASASGAITLKDDPRITRLGRWLRRVRLDELPQLVNIVRGDMSWIGPRPEAKALSDLYEREIPFYRYRHVVRPGITGWAQVRQGHVTSVADVQAKLEYDFYYAKHFSFWLDVLVGLQTITIMLSGRGAK